MFVTITHDSTVLNARQILSHNIRQLRLRHGWSQEQLAERCGLHRTYIGAVERGERNLGLDNLERLARALNTSAASMLEELHAVTAPHRVGEIPASYDISRSSTQRKGRHTTGQIAAYRRQYATHSLSTGAPDFFVMTLHESKCKEASGSAYSAAAHQPWLVAGGAG